MEQTKQHSPAYVARRVADRAARRVARDPLALLALALLGVLLVFGLPAVLSSAEASSLPTNSAEQYMRALKDRDPESLYESLSPELRLKLGGNSGRVGVSAAVSLMQDQAQRGDRVVDYRRIGHYETVQGEHLYFYVVRFENNGQRQDVPYTITVGPNGTITKIE